MGEARTALQALAELERRFDGPIPEPLRRAAQFGSPARACALAAEGQAVFFTSLIRHQLEGLRRADADDPSRPRLVADLVLYRRQRRFWRGEAKRLRVSCQARPVSVT